MRSLALQIVKEQVRKDITESQDAKRKIRTELDNLLATHDLLAGRPLEETLQWRDDWRIACTEYSDWKISYCDLLDSYECLGIITSPKQEAHPVNLISSDTSLQATSEDDVASDDAPVDRSGRCRCSCGCRRQPASRVWCLICGCPVGPGCCLVEEFPTKEKWREGICHVCHLGSMDRLSDGVFCSAWSSSCHPSISVPGSFTFMDGSPSTSQNQFGDSSREW